MTRDPEIQIAIRGQIYSFHQDYMPSFVADRRARNVYVVNPKCGCTTIKNIMFATDRGFMYIHPDNIHSSFFSFWRVNKFSLDNDNIKRIGGQGTFLFSAVHHPFNRYVSGFVDKFLSNKDPNYWEARDLISAYLSIDVHGNPVRAAIAYLEWLERGELPFSRVGQARDPHFRPQVDNLGVPHGLALDYVGRIEDLGALIGKLEEAGGRAVPNMIGWRFQQSNHDAKQALLDSKELGELVRRVYRSDFETFGYE